MNPLLFFCFLVLGLIVGSFLGALSFRIVRGISIAKGRSLCPKCKKQIAWFDNFPVLSYLFLTGKCRKCQKPISVRYPLIELTTSFVFGGFYFLISNCSSFSWLEGSLTCQWWLGATTGYLQVIFGLVVLVLLSLLLTILITDFEHQIIPDNLVFVGLLVFVLVLFIGGSERLFVYLLSGLATSLFFLLLHLVTKGKGMGLGDVKLSLLLGMILGWPNVLLWLCLSTLTGSVVGTILILVKKTKFGKTIAFGPFMVVAFVLMLFLDALIKQKLLI